MDENKIGKSYESQEQDKNKRDLSHTRCRLWWDAQQESDCVVAKDPEDQTKP